MSKKARFNVGEPASRGGQFKRVSHGEATVELAKEPFRLEPKGAFGTSAGGQFLPIDWDADNQAAAEPKGAFGTSAGGQFLPID